jgi:hypothetical protein
VKRRLQELLELSLSHPVALNLQVIFRIAFVVYVVRRIDENKIRGITSHQRGHVGAISRITDEQLVVPQNPEITGPADGLC